MSKTAIRSLIVAFLISLSIIAYLLAEKLSPPLSHSVDSTLSTSTSANLSSSDKPLNFNTNVQEEQPLSSAETDELSTVLVQLPQIAKQPYSDQIRQVNQWLQIWPYESLLLIHLAKIQAELGQFDEAASNLYEALQYAETPQLVTKAKSLLLYTLNRYGKDLSLSKDWLNLETLYLQYQDTLILYQGWGELAQQHGKNLLDAERYQELEYFIQDWSGVSAAKADLTHFSNQLDFTQNASLSSSRAIPLRQWGTHFLVTAFINDYEVNLLIDTGASQTVLTSEAFGVLASAISPYEQRQQPFNTAGGQVEGSVIFPVDIKIGDFEVRKTSIAVLEFNAPYDGLLGMNFLSQFEFEIDQQGHLLFLTLPD